MTDFKRAVSMRKKRLSNAAAQLTGLKGDEMKNILKVRKSVKVVLDPNLEI